MENKEYLEFAKAKELKKIEDTIIGTTYKEYTIKNIVN